MEDVQKILQKTNDMRENYYEYNGKIVQKLELLLHKYFFYFNFITPRSFLVRRAAHQF